MADSECEDCYEYKPYIHQVAGHTGVTGLLCNGDGYVLKPVQQPPKGRREQEFYEWLFTTQDLRPEMLELRRFLPKYHGTVELKVSAEGPSRQYLKLEDVTNNFKFPCILDVKIGRVTWDQTADQEKINSRRRKWPLQNTLGFSILGFRVYDPRSECYESIEKATCKSLATMQEVDQLFSVYLNGAAGDKRSITGNIISQLLAIQQFFEKQKMLKFIASSLLVVYEANTTDKGAEMSNMNDNTVGAPRHSSPQSMSSDPQTEVRMIDMAHVFEHQEQDDNYLFGLNSLIMHFERQK